MSRLPKLSLLVPLLFLSSCSLFKELSSDDVTRITSEYFDENHDMVFYSTLSLLQAEQFTIVQADKESGIIRGTRHTERDDVERNLKTFGTATERESTEAVFLILPLSDKRTEVKLSLYRNELTVTRKNEVNQKQTSHTMLLKESTYDKWLNKLKAEVKRRKSSFNRRRESLVFQTAFYMPIDVFGGYLFRRTFLEDCFFSLTMGSTARCET